MEHIDEQNFEEMTKKGLVLVDFFADWCGPCKMLTPVLEEVAAEMEGKAIIAKLDIDKSQAIASKFQVTSVPTLILFKDGAEVGRLVGLRDAPAIKEFIQNA
ncbi:MAG: thioredoxin [Candidatus Algichlamydia australiensis]|nr:thioredoxin [Chlamydiales bacterium]